MDDTATSYLEATERRFGATPDEVVTGLLYVVDAYLPPDVAVRLLLEHASEVALQAVCDAECQQHWYGKADNLDVLERMRHIVSAFASAAGCLVKPALAGSRWPTHHRGMQ